MGSPSDSHRGKHGPKIPRSRFHATYRSLAEWRSSPVSSELKGYIDRIDDWINNTIAQPIPGHQELGPVCPWTPAALRLDSLRVTFCDTGGGPDLIAAAINHTIRKFASSRPSSGARSLYHLVGVIFTPETPGLYDYLEARQPEAKLLAARHGAMLGLFHPNRTRPSLTHKGAPTLRSPVPILLVRSLLPQDRNIFANPEVPAQEREQRLEIFEEWLHARTEKQAASRDKG